MSPHNEERPQAERENAPRDAGRTSGGGSLGHKQPHEVEEATSIRNNERGQRERQERSDERT